MKKQILIISIISLFAIQLLAEQKQKEITPEENCPLIDQFPDTFRRYNELKTIWINKINKMTKTEKLNLNDQFSKDFKEKLATEYINIKLFYSQIDRQDKFHSYYKNYGKLGFFTEELFHLKYPYNYFLPQCDGIVLVKVLNDTILPRAVASISSGKRHMRILHAKVIDDLFNTIEEDTIFVSHDYNIYDKLFFKYDFPYLLFAVRSGQDRFYGDIRIHTYFMLGKTRTREDMIDFPKRFPPRVEHAFVVNDTIRDPYHVYDFDGYSYEDFKIQFLTDVKNAGIRK